MSRGDRQQDIAWLEKNLGYPKETHPVIYESNMFATELSFLLDLAVKEITELEQEEIASEGWVMEFEDVMVFLRTILSCIAPSFSVEAAELHVNGQFHRGQIREKKLDLSHLKEQALNLGEGNPESNVKHFLTSLLSMLKHLDIDLQIEVHAGVLQDKLNKNKEDKYYRKEPGMTLSDVADKYTHVTQALREIRNFLKRTTGQEIVLQPWITEFFATEIMDWRQSEVALKRLKQKFTLFQQKIKDEAVWQKTALPMGKQDQNLQLKMLLAGAVPLAMPVEMDAALQDSAHNATLSHKTIFWA